MCIHNVNYTLAVVELDLMYTHSIVLVPGARIVEDFELLDLLIVSCSSSSRTSITDKLHTFVRRLDLVVQRLCFVCQTIGQL